MAQEALDQLALDQEAELQEALDQEALDQDAELQDAFAQLALDHEAEFQEAFVEAVAYQASASNLYVLPFDETNWFKPALGFGGAVTPSVGFPLITPMPRPPLEL